MSSGLPFTLLIPHPVSIQNHLLILGSSCLFCIQHFSSKTQHNSLWWFCRGCSPLPIPNREVKPLMADGTAQQCGRVGSCHIYLASSFLMRLFYFRLLIADSAWSTMTINSLVVLRPYV